MTTPDVRRLSRAGFYRVEKVRYGYQVAHVGTGLVVPHCGTFRAPSRVTGGVVIQYLSDAVEFANKVESFEGMNTESRPSRLAIQEVSAALQNEARASGASR